MIIELLTQKGFVRDVDYSYENVELAAIQKTRTVIQEIEMQPDANHPEPWIDSVEVLETYVEDIPSLASLKKEAVEISDPALLIEAFLVGKQLDENDSINMDLFLKGHGGWRFAYVAAPSIDDLYSLIDSVRQAQEQKAARAARIETGKRDRVKCETALDLIAGYNRERVLSIEQITQMQQTFAQAESLLKANRPDFAAQVISNIVPDGTLVTQEMKDEVLLILQQP